MDEQIKPVAWRAKTPHGWVVGKTQHSSCDEPLYPQQAIDALRAEVERLQSDTSFATAISSLRREKERAERLAEALRLALNSHGKTLLTDPPQDAWKVNRVEEIGRALLREQEEGHEQ